MKKIAIIQARMGSTRLPGKVLKTLAGKPVLEHVIERASRIEGIDGVVIATTTDHEDDVLVQFVQNTSAKVFRGSENDVLSRYYLAAKENNADVIMRITSDCPMISPKVSGEVLSLFLKNSSHWEYASNVPDDHRSFPRGLDTEVFSFSALERANSEARLQPDREHVTPFIRRETPSNKMGELLNNKDFSQHRWTLDTEEDYELLSKLVGSLYPESPQYEWEDALSLLERHPEWSSINAHIEQKKYGE